MTDKTGEIIQAQISTDPVKVAELVVTENDSDSFSDGLDDEPPAVELIVTLEPPPKVVDKADLSTNKLTSGGSRTLMIQMPSGSFRMGSSTGILSVDESPIHEVKISLVMVLVDEITFAEYDRFAKVTGRQLATTHWDRKTYPADNVSWDDAIAYLGWLSKKTGKYYRLLSEAEWEYDAHAGTKSSYWWGLTPSVDNANCFDCMSDISSNNPAKVGIYQPNRFGLYDTAGNMFEWVHDCYHRCYKDASTDGSVWEGAPILVQLAQCA
ncbi:MAG: sulfatase activating formylglycine-generating enzyme [Urechidicola sp.]|jgi:formylglycine-generating enzyme required for sulfatase activity